MKLALDHHYSHAIAIALRGHEHDVIVARERSWETEDDEALLFLCAQKQRALLTNNVGDFTVIARRWALEGRPHSGLVFTADASMPRTRENVGRYVWALDALLRSNPNDEAFTDRVHWL